jgi:hypothetical protein
MLSIEEEVRLMVTNINYILAEVDINTVRMLGGLYARTDNSSERGSVPMNFNREDIWR